MSRPEVLRRAFYEAGAVEVAPLLLNKLLVGRGRVGRIVEVEAYMGPHDPASHAYRGLTRRNATMFGPGGHLYVYFTYGMHFCANIVCGPEGTPEAVLLRALAPVSGLELMRRARTAPGLDLSAVGGSPDRGSKGRGLLRDRDLASGPAKLCQAFGIDRHDDGADLVVGDLDLVVADDGTPSPSKPGVSGRIGVAVAAEIPWRWWVDGDENVSRGAPAPSPRAASATRSRARAVT